jgi:hypothetical protein
LGKRAMQHTPFNTSKLKVRFWTCVVSVTMLADSRRNSPTALVISAGVIELLLRTLHTNDLYDVVE